MSHKNLVGAIDQGTSSSRFLVFDADTEELVAQHQERYSIEALTVSVTPVTVTQYRAIWLQ